MKKKSSRRSNGSNADTLRHEYDFSGSVRGATAARYKEGTNVVVVDKDLLDVFPDSASVNDALRALAKVVRRRRQPSKRKSA